MFERFTEQARAVVRVAQEEARRLDQRVTDTEHLLLGVLADTDGLAVAVLSEAGATAGDLRARVERQVARGSQVFGEADAAALREIGIDLDTVVARIEESFGAGAMTGPVQPPRRRGWGRLLQELGGSFSPRAKKVLELALREALRLRHRRIGTEHILLGLVREGHGVAASVLTEAGLTLDDLRRRMESARRAAA